MLGMFFETQCRLWHNY